MREINYHAIILKKQPFKEADEIITLFTKEQGKIRALAKSVKSSKSKLQQKLQALFLVEVRLALGKMPKIIGVETVKVYFRLRENLHAIKIAFYATELVLKLTADEQKNEILFNLLDEFFDFLDKEQDERILDLGLAKFKISVLEASGLEITEPTNIDGKSISFSVSRGGFILEKHFDGLEVKSSVFKLFTTLKKTSISNLYTLEGEVGDLQNLLSQFIEYQLERRLMSEKFLRL